MRYVRPVLLGSVVRLFSHHDAALEKVVHHARRRSVRHGRVEPLGDLGQRLGRQTGVN